MTGLPSHGASSDDIRILWQRRFWLGDAAIVLPRASVALRRRMSLARRTGVVCDVVCGPEDIALYLAHPLIDESAVLAWLESAMAVDAGMGGEAETAAGRAGGVAGNHTDQPRLHRFAVRYGGAGTDLDELARRLALSPADVIALHTGQGYEVAALGFAPGFAYLTETPDALRAARQSAPRLSVAAGAVAVAHRYTAIYPRESAAGWWVIGHASPQDVGRLWRPGEPYPALFAIGDRVVFRACPADESGDD